MTKNITCLSDFIEYLQKRKQNLLVVSSNVLFEKNNLILVNKGDFITLEEHDFGLHENFLNLIMKHTWSFDDIKLIIGYCGIMSLYINKEHEIYRSAASINDVVSGMWKAAYVSEDDILSYRERLHSYNKLVTPHANILSNLGYISGPKAPVNPLYQVKSFSIKGLELLLKLKEPLILTKILPYPTDLMSSSDGFVFFKQCDLEYFLNIKYDRHQSPEDGIVQDSIEYVGEDIYRVQRVACSNGESMNVFRLQQTETPTFKELGISR